MTREKKPARDNAEILTEKANKIGNNLNKQIANLKKLQKNAIKDKKLVEIYNKMVLHFSETIAKLEMDSSTIIETESEFDINNME